METRLNTCFVGPTRVNIPNGISIGSAIFAAHDCGRHMQIDRPRYSACNNKPHLRSTAMRPNNNNANDSVYGAVIRAMPLREFIRFIKGHAKTR